MTELVTQLTNISLGQIQNLVNGHEAKLLILISGCIDVYGYDYRVLYGVRMSGFCPEGFVQRCHVGELKQPNFFR